MKNNLFVIALNEIGARSARAMASSSKTTSIA